MCSVCVFCGRLRRVGEPTAAFWELSDIRAPLNRDGSRTERLLYNLKEGAVMKFTLQKRPATSDPNSCFFFFFNPKCLTCPHISTFAASLTCSECSPVSLKRLIAHIKSPSVLKAARSPVILRDPVNLSQPKPEIEPKLAPSENQFIHSPDPLQVPTSK